MLRKSTKAQIKAATAAAASIFATLRKMFSEECIDEMGGLWQDHKTTFRVLTTCGWLEVSAHPSHFNGELELNTQFQNTGKKWNHYLPAADIVTQITDLFARLVPRAQDVPALQFAGAMQDLYMARCDWLMGRCMFNLKLATKKRVIVIQSWRPFHRTYQYDEERRLAVAAITAEFSGLAAAA